MLPDSEGLFIEVRVEKHCLLLLLGELDAKPSELGVWNFGVHGAAPG